MADTEVSNQDIQQSEHYGFSKMEQVRNPLSLDPVGYRGKDLRFSQA